MAELVGGALLSSFFNVVLDRLSSPEFVNLIQGKKLDQRLLRKLERSMYVVQALLNDAERKQITDPVVKKWLADLEDTVYVADDLLDEVHTKAAAQKHPGNLWSRYFKFNVQDSKIVAKIEEIIDTLEDIAKHKDILGLKNISTEDMSWRTPSSSLVEKSDIYGRDVDKEKIIELLLDDSEISVISIVGMGGVGKTTLAQLVYNDDQLKGNFDFKAWVCVEENFDVVKMTKYILEVISSPCDKNDLDSIQLKLKDELIGKRFLVVLDDMWDISNDGWKNFQKPFLCGSGGSKIVVTTRDDNVASVVQTVQPYKLRPLSNKDCSSLFAKHASLSPESPYYSSLKEVGEKIVEKCKGLPLAIQTLGSLLRTKHNVGDWNKILESKIWEFSENESKILPALRISYHYLPSHLKRCFVFCSLYPKDYEFDRDELVLLWMAEDFLQPPKSGSTLEESGCECFNDLVSRSFFQPSNISENLFVMHDLMHDLATFYARKFYLRASELGTATNVDLKIRHLSCDIKDKYPVLKFVEACDSLKHARTMLQTSFNRFSYFQEEIMYPISPLLSQLKCLRVLSMQYFPLDSLPDSIGELIHLRYLDLTKARIVTLPESLSKLYNLQTLKLRGCEKLKMLPSSMQDLVNLHHLDLSEAVTVTLSESLGKLYNLQTLKLKGCRSLKMLPSNMQDLVNLRHLDIRGTCFQVMPKGMNKLKDLQFLSDYIVGGHNENGIRELGALTNLHGSLAIHKLENVLDSGEASEARMINKEHIDDLEFNWSSWCDNIADFQIEKDIFDKLQSCTKLKELKIQGYRGREFSDWLGQSSYQSMTTLTLSECRNCCKLPSLGQLPSLKKLKISKFDKLPSIDFKFYNNDEFCQKTPFPSLETLELDTLSSWREWNSSQFDAAFPKLKKLALKHCPKLTGNLPNHLLALEGLDISECMELTCSLPRAPNFLRLEISGTHKLRLQEVPLSLCSLSIEGNQLVRLAFEAMTHTQLTCLQSLSISNYSLATSFPWACMPASLQDLKIRGCKNLKFPMQQQQQQESLRSLRIHNCFDSLTSFPLAAFPNLTSLEIEYCANMKCLEVSQSKDVAVVPSSLRQLTIRACGSFVSFSTLGKVAPQLEHLTIQGCPEVDSFGEEEEGDGSLPPSLRYLSILGCEKLVRCIASSTVLHGCSLTYLWISDACDSVKSFPGEGSLPASLGTLCLVDFPSLETLDCKGLLHLTSLQDLTIGGCPKLKNIVGERLPASLEHLNIHGSPLLGERCREGDQQIWPKISHIPTIKVDWTRISDPRSSTGTDAEEKCCNCKGYFKCFRT